MGVQLRKQSIDLGVVTTNGAAMVAFYRDLIGLKYLREIRMPGDWGVMHQMLCGESMIKLIVLDSAPAAAPPGGIQGATGYRYWTVTVSNPREVVAAIKEAGHKVIFESVEVRPGVIIDMIEDPDGNWVELLAIA